MATIRLVPSHYDRSSTNRVTVTDETNMYYNTDHTANYATIRGRNSSNNTYYAFINGFNFNDVPSDVIVNSFTIKIKAYRNSYQSTGSSYRLRLCSSASTGSVISNTTLSSDLATGTTGAVYTFPNGDLTWGQLSSYGSAFSIEIPLRPTSNNYPYVYVYGAEILVDYTLPTYHNVSASSDSQTVTVQPSTQSVLEGSDAFVTFNNVSDLSAITVKDNGVDVTSSLAVEQGGNVSLNPSNYETGTTAVINPENGYTSTSSTNYSQLRLSGSTSYMYYLFDTSSIPQNATIESVDCSVKYAISVTSSSITNKVIQLYSSNTAKGSPLTISTTTAVTTSSLTTGTWTRSEVENIKLRLSATYTGRNEYYFNFYGADLTITYTVPQGTYTYTISNIQAAHTITVEDKSSPYTTKKSYVKKNSQFKEVSKVYKKGGNAWGEKTITSILWKVNGSWIETNSPMSGRTAFKMEV